MTSDPRFKVIASIVKAYWFRYCDIFSFSCKIIFTHLRLSFLSGMAEMEVAESYRAMQFQEDSESEQEAEDSVATVRDECSYTDDNSSSAYFSPKVLYAKQKYHETCLNEDPDASFTTKRQTQWKDQLEARSKKMESGNHYLQTPHWNHIYVIPPSTTERKEWDRISNFHYVSTIIGRLICAICNKGFANRSTLQVHLRIHSGERPYKCRVCDKSFTQSGNLRTHTRVHTGERPFTCSRCNESFTQSSTLNKHIKRKH